MFEKASRLQIRFETPQGKISYEDLWSLPMTSTRTNVANLDAIAVGLYNQLQQNNTKSFVVDTPKSNEELQLKFDIAKHVIDVRKEEGKAAAQAKANREMRQKLIAIRAQKQDENILGKSLAEIDALIASIPE